MNVTFWQCKSELWYWIFLITLCFIMAIISIILKWHWLGQAMFIGMMVACIIMLFALKKLLSKIRFSEEGIECIRFKKQIVFIRWDEITDVLETPYGRFTHWLTFMSGSKRIDIDVLSKKMYNAIIEICPEPNIRMMINEINSLKYFHRDK